VPGAFVECGTWFGGCAFGIALAQKRVLDDYYAWDGAARAAHDWLSANDAAYRIRQGG
jgi:hypothetical protein